MMAFSTASSRSIAERWRRLLCLLLWLPLLAWAAEIEVNNPQLLASDDGYVLNADFAFGSTTNS